MINIPEAFYNDTAAIRVTMEQFVNLLTQFQVDETQVWNPDYLKKMGKTKN